MQGQQQRGRFLEKTGKDRDKAIQEIKEKIASGAFSSKSVLSSIVEKLEPHFSASIENY